MHQVIMVPLLVMVEIVIGLIFLFFSFLFSSFSPFSSQTHKKKKKSTIGQRIVYCGFVNFLGALRMLMNFMGLCFKLRTEVVVVGIGGLKGKKKGNAWVKVSGFGRREKKHHCEESERKKG